MCFGKVPKNPTYFVNPNLRLIAYAKQWVGKVKEYGQNRGPDVERFLKQTGGVPGDPWCMAFLQYLVKVVERDLRVTSRISRSIHVLTCWQQTHLDYHVDPKPGRLMMWNVPRTTRGHAALVRTVQGDRIGTIEGNTNERGRREGDGVYERSRSLHGSSTFRVLGFIEPFQDPTRG